MIPRTRRRFVSLRSFSSSIKHCASWSPCYSLRFSLNGIAAASSSSSNNAFASCKSFVSNPSVNQPEICASICHACFLLPSCCHSRHKLITARSSKDFALCWRVISMAFQKHSSVSLTLDSRPWTLDSCSLRFTTTRPVRCRKTFRRCRPGSCPPTQPVRRRAHSAPSAPGARTPRHVDNPTR